MKKQITGTITIAYEINCVVPDSFNYIEIEEYIKDNLDECIEWHKDDIVDINYQEETITEETNEPEDNTYSGGVIE